MRVIRTEMYFDPREINWPLPELVTNTPGIAAAYFQIDTELGPDDVRGQLSWLILHPEYDERIIRLFLDASLWGSGSLFPEPRQEGEEFNPTIINYILEQSIIIEARANKIEDRMYKRKVAQSVHIRSSAQLFPPDPGSRNAADFDLSME